MRLQLPYSSPPLFLSFSFSCINPLLLSLLSCRKVFNNWEINHRRSSRRSRSTSLPAPDFRLSQERGESVVITHYVIIRFFFHARRAGGTRSSTYARACNRRWQACFTPIVRNFALPRAKLSVDRRTNSIIDAS